jgi:hypothetical protein
MLQLAAQTSCFRLPLANTMRITINHCRYAPRWETINQVIREATNDPKGQLIRISRRDNGCDYRAPGIYDLDFRYGGERRDIVLPIELEIVG